MLALIIVEFFSWPITFNLATIGFLGVPVL